MPSKKKKYNARFPAGRIKKMMQTDEEIGKVAQAVPVIISRTLELFVESLLTKSMLVTNSRNAKTLTPSHMKLCILSESKFDFLKDLVNSIPDVSNVEDEPCTPGGNNSPGTLSNNVTTKSYPGFQFNTDRKLSETSLSRSYSSTSQNSTEDEPVFTPTTNKTTSLFPRFYNEIPIGMDSGSSETHKVIKSPVIQYASTTSSSSSNIKHNTRSTNNKTKSVIVVNNEDDDEDDKDEDHGQVTGDNGTNDTNNSVNGLVLKTLNNEKVIDEDYDT